MCVLRIPKLTLRREGATRQCLRYVADAIVVMILNLCTRSRSIETGAQDIQRKASRLQPCL